MDIGAHEQTTASTRRPGKVSSTASPDADNGAMARWITGLLWLHAAAVGVLTFATIAAPPAAALLPGGASLLLAAAGTAAWVRRTPHAPSILAACVIGTTALLAWRLAASGWPAWADAAGIATLAVLALVQNRRAVICAAAVTAAELVLLAAFAPAAATSSPLTLLPRAASVLIVACLAAWFITRIEHAKRNAASIIAAAQDEERALRLTSETATDLAARAAEERAAYDFQREVGGLVGEAAVAAQSVRQAVEQISGVAQDASRRTATVTSSSREILASAQNVASSVDELAGSISRVSAELRDVSDASFRAMEDASTTNATVQGLADTAGRIGQVISVINGIARQTNMLALNATIEAQRAGEAGRGFSVVAQEVKALAQQTAAATRQIEREVATIHVEMATAMNAIDGMAGTVANLGGITVSVAGAMEDQAQIAQDIAASAMRAAEGTQSVASNLSGLTEQAERGDAAALEGAREADRLAEKCTELDHAVRAFVTALLAA